MSEVVQQDNLNQPKRTLIYDGNCRLCVAAKAGLERAGSDPGLKWLPYQSGEAAACLGGAYRPGRPDVAFLVDEEGRISRGLDAFLPLLPGLRGGRFLLTLLQVPLARPLALLAYRLISRYRYQLFGQVSSQRAPRD